MFENSDYMHTFVEDFVVILSCASNPSSRKIESKSGETFLIMHQNSKSFESYY
jgi:hypothetical protein